MSTQKSVLRSGCQIDPSPVVASAWNAKLGVISSGSFTQEVPSIMINANNTLINKFLMVLSNVTRQRYKIVLHCHGKRLFM